MKILLVNPPNSGRSIPVEKYGLTSFSRIFRGEPLALETLAGNLPDHDVELLDLKVDPRAYRDVLTEFQPDIVGFTGVTCEANNILRLAGETRDHSDALVVIGGIQATYDPAFFNHPHVDYIVSGLGKLSFKELMDAIESPSPADQIPGVARTNTNGTLHFTPRQFNQSDLAGQAPPRYDLVEKYRSSYVLGSIGLHIGFVNTSLGCPHNCSFCSVGKLTGNRYLGHTIETIIRDVQLLDGTPIIRLVDANTFANVNRAESLGKALKDTNLKKDYVAEARADSITAHPELFELWKAVGLRFVVVGFEEVSDSRLQAYDKRTSVAQNAHAVKILHELGLTIVGDFIVSPDYSEKDFDDLEDFIVSNQIDIPMLTVLTPLPGTSLYEELKGRIVIDNLDYYTLTNAVLPTRLDEDVFYARYAGVMNVFHDKAGM